MNFARSLGRFAPGDERVDSVTRMEKELGTPSLRTAGLMLVHRRRGDSLEKRIADNKAKNDKAEAIFQAPPNSNPPPPELWAEDLVRGLRFDVWDGTTELWRSLEDRDVVDSMPLELDGCSDPAEAGADDRNRQRTGRVGV